MLCICAVTWLWHMACLGDTLSVWRRSEDMDLHCQDLDIASLLWLIWKPETGWLAVIWLSCRRLLCIPTI